MKPNALFPSMIAAALAAGCAAAPAPAARTEAPPVAVAIGRAQVSELSTAFDAGGVVRARSTAVIASRIMAPITDVFVRPGDRVRLGAPLVRLDAREIDASNVRAAAGLTAATQTADAAESDTRSAEAALRIAQLTHERIASLQVRRSATAQELDQATATLAAAEAQLGAARARAAAAGAARDEARAAAHGAQIAATYTTLTAPFDGVISERHADPGTLATPGTPLLTLEEPGGLRLEVRLDEARVMQVAVGQTAAAGLDESGDAWLPARIVEIARLDPASHAFVVKLALPDDARARSGQFGRARFSGPSRRALTVPAAAVVRRGQLAFVFVVDANGTAHLRPVSLGATADGLVEALAGVHDGDRVVVDAAPALSDGARVTGAAR